VTSKRGRPSARHLEERTQETSATPRRTSSTSERTHLPQHRRLFDHEPRRQRDSAPSLTAGRSTQPAAVLRRDEKQHKWTTISFCSYTCHDVITHVFQSFISAGTFKLHLPPAEDDKCSLVNCCVMHDLSSRTFHYISQFRRTCDLFV